MVALRTCSDFISQTRIIRMRSLHCLAADRSAKTGATVIAARRSGAQPHVAQHVRPSVPGHHLGREPRAGDRLRRRRLPARHRARAAEEIQEYLDKRRPGQSRFTTQRREPDAVRILSGVFATRPAARSRPARRSRSSSTTSTSARRTTARSRTSSGPATRISPTGEIRHPRLPRRRALIGARDGDAGRRRGDRAQGRARRADPRRAGADRARIKIDRSRWDWDEVDNNPFFRPDAGIVETWDELPRRACARAAPPCGAVIEVVAEGVPAGWGAPIYGKLDQDLAARDDEHQRREGRRDRRRHGGG